MADHLEQAADTIEHAATRFGDWYYTILATQPRLDIDDYDNADSVNDEIVETISKFTSAVAQACADGAAKVRAEADALRSLLRTSPVASVRSDRPQQHAAPSLTTAPPGSSRFDGAVPPAQVSMLSSRPTDLFGFLSLRPPSPSEIERSAAQRVESGRLLGAIREMLSARFGLAVRPVTSFEVVPGLGETGFLGLKFSTCNVVVDLDDASTWDGKFTLLHETLHACSPGMFTPECEMFFKLHGRGWEEGTVEAMSTYVGELWFRRDAFDMHIPAYRKFFDEFERLRELSGMEPLEFYPLMMQRTPPQRRQWAERLLIDHFETRHRTRKAGRLAHKTLKSIDAVMLGTGDV